MRKILFILLIFGFSAACEAQSGQIRAFLTGSFDLKGRRLIGPMSAIVSGHLRITAADTSRTLIYSYNLATAGLIPGKKAIRVFLASGAALDQQAIPQNDSLITVLAPDYWTASFQLSTADAQTLSADPVKRVEFYSGENTFSIDIDKKHQWAIRDAVKSLNTAVQPWTR